VRVVEPLTSIVDAVHSPTADVVAWLEEIRAAGERTFEGFLAVQAFVARIHPDRAELGTVATDERFRQAIVNAFAAADASILAHFHSGVSTTAHMVPRDHPLRAQAGEDGVMEVWSAFGFADATRLCGVSLLLPSQRASIARKARVSLARLSAHVAAAYRLRARGTGDGEAVLSPRGAVLHAEGGAKDRRAREHLRDAALAVARARGARDPEAGLAMWRAMVDGRWTLVERFESDGKRFFVAKPNAPASLRHHALSARERGVLERAALGGTLSLVAYELGIPESTVHVVLARAMKKIGLGSREQLIELRAALVAAGDGAVGQS
jgi:DNA-binding CsgD family transcriptional regulator